MALRRSTLSDSEVTFVHRAENTLDVARAARETLIAMRDLARERKNEAQLQLQVWHDEEEDLNDRVQAAVQQVGKLINDMNMEPIFSTSIAGMDDDDDDDGCSTSYEAKVETGARDVFNLHHSCVHSTLITPTSESHRSSVVDSDEETRSRSSSA